MAAIAFLANIPGQGPEPPGYAALQVTWSHGSRSSDYFQGTEVLESYRRSRRSDRGARGQGVRSRGVASRERTPEQRAVLVEKVNRHC